MSKLYHKTPCAECPWRKNSAKGWLGGHSPEFYADAPVHNEPTSCHCKDFGPDDDRTAFCAGALSVMANACIMADDSKHPGAEAARRAVGKRDDTFDHPRDFYEYHAGKPYVSPLMRALQERENAN